MSLVPNSKSFRDQGFGRNIGALIFILFFRGFLIMYILLFRGFLIIIIV